MSDAVRLGAEVLVVEPQRLLDRGLVGHVAGHGDRARELGRHRLRAALVEVGDGDATALGRDAAGDRRGDAGAASGGEQDLVGEAHAGTPWLRQRDGIAVVTG